MYNSSVLRRDGPASCGARHFFIGKMATKKSGSAFRLAVLSANTIGDRASEQVNRGPEQAVETRLPTARSDTKSIVAGTLRVPNSAHGVCRPLWELATPGAG